MTSFKNASKKWKSAAETSKLREENAEARKLAVAAFDVQALKKICQMPFEGFSEYADIYSNDSQSFYYKNNGSGVLGVCHLDSVMDSNTFGHCNTAVGPIVYCPTLDDRLGAYIILEWLPKLGIKLDWLLCDDEESGRSSARIFISKKSYRWMAEFDRAGEDVVMYQYEDQASINILEDYGWDVGTGSVSDISYLSDLRCKGFNFGVSYQDYHGPESHAYISRLFDCVGRFIRMYGDYSEVEMPHDPADESVSGKSYYGGYSYDDGYYDGLTSHYQQSNKDSEPYDASLQKKEEGREVTAYGDGYSQGFSERWEIFEEVYEEITGDCPVSLGVVYCWDACADIHNGHSFYGPRSGEEMNDILLYGAQHQFSVLDDPDQDGSINNEPSFSYMWWDWYEIKVILMIAAAYEKMLDVTELEAMDEDQRPEMG